MWPSLLPWLPPSASHQVKTVSSQLQSDTAHNHTVYILRKDGFGDENATDNADNADNAREHEAAVVRPSDKKQQSDSDRVWQPQQ